MIELLFYIMFFPIILAFKLFGWIIKGILAILRMIGFIDIFK
jgi:hypothetical protein